MTNTNANYTALARRIEANIARTEARLAELRAQLEGLAAIQQIANQAQPSLPLDGRKGK